MTIVYGIIVGLIGYLLGSVNSSVIISKIFYKKDVREFGSKNAGLTNTLRVLGKKAAIFVLVGDILKGVIACIIGSLIIPEYGVAIAGLFAVIGHNWPVYFGFKGGKGVLTSATVIFMIDWKIGLIAIGIFALIVILTKYVSLGSMIAAISAFVVCIIFQKDIVTTICVLTFVTLIIYRHRANIKRLINKEESKLSFKK